MLGLGLLLNNAAQQLKREFERAARPHGLTLLQWRVLRALAVEDGQTQKSLATQLEASPMSISDVLERLEATGHVTREVDPTDSRAKRASLTDEGRAIVREMRAIAVQVYDQAAAGINEADKQTMMRVLAQILANLDALGAQKKDET